LVLRFRVVPREWIAPPDHDTADGELLEEDEEDESVSMLRQDTRRSTATTALERLMMRAGIVTEIAAVAEVAKVRARSEIRMEGYYPPVSELLHQEFIEILRRGYSIGAFQAFIPRYHNQHCGSSTLFFYGSACIPSSILTRTSV
jgi:endonuclease III-like uncharacterized protein